MLDDAVKFLRGAGQKARDVDEGDDRNLERVAEADEARRFLRRIDVEHAREHERLVRDAADRATLDAPEAADDVSGMRWLPLEEIALVDRLNRQSVVMGQSVSCRLDLGGPLNHKKKKQTI